MSIREVLGDERFEQIRTTIEKAFPDPRNRVPDEFVNAVVEELQRRGLPGIEKLRLPPVSPTTAPEETAATTSYPLYMASATHHRVRAVDSAAPFESEFVGHLPTVRVPLPQALNFENTTLKTPIGDVHFASDHLAGSVELIARLYEPELGYTPARVDLVTPARKLGVRFAAIAVYLGYQRASDTTPSFYVLEAGLATGEPAMLYLGKTMDTTIVQNSGYQPTPFAAPGNTYTGKLLVHSDEPKQLWIQANQPNLPFYIQVTVDYELITSPKGHLPITLLTEAIERVAAIGKKMGVPAGMPAIVEDVLSGVALLFLPWIEKPTAAPPTPPLAQYRPERAARASQWATTSPALLDELRDAANQSTKAAIPRLKALLSGTSVQKRPVDFSVLPNGAEVVALASEIALGSGPDGSITGTGQRQTWANQLANQKVQPLQIFRPTSLNAHGDPQSIEAVLLSALTTKSAARAAGSGHSYSDVATTPDFFIDTHGLNRLSDPQNPITGQLSQSVLVEKALPLALTPLTWDKYDPENNHALIEMEAGITISALNPLLDSRNVGLMNMGGYDGQTIIGATSTSTHGSGIGLGPFPDMVRSLVIATTGTWDGKTVGGKDPGYGVHYYRIEPTNGITDPAKYSDPLIQLIQDDDCFNAVICGMGCFGVIYSVVIEVMQMYWLSEFRYITSLEQLMKELQPNPNNPGHLPDVLLHTRNYEVLIHPYPMSDGKVVTMDLTHPASTYDKYFTCLVTTRKIVSAPTYPLIPRPAMEDWVEELLNIALHIEPAFTPLAIDISMFTLVLDDMIANPFGYVNHSYNIYNLSLAGGFGFAAEIGFSLEDSDGNYTPAVFRQAIDEIHAIAQRAREQGTQYQTSAFSLRFVNASNAHLSMMQGRKTAMIEMDMMTGTYGGEEIMYRYETSMYALGGRPHWGLEFDYLTGSNGMLSKLYPKLDTWMNVYKQFNRLGTFNNRFTQRMGFTSLR